MSLLAAIALVAVTADPRVELLNAQRAGDLRGALVAAERFAADDPERSRALGLSLLRGHLLARLGRLPEAAAAFAAALGETPDLEPWARLRLAETEEALGHPEVAAGLAATLLSRGAPPTLQRPAALLLVRSLRRGGDCRLLAGIGAPLVATAGASPAMRNAGREIERQLELARAGCALRAGEIKGAQRRVTALLLEDAVDLAAFDAAELWLERWPPPDERKLLRSLGAALAGQRDFERAAPILELALAGEERTGSAAESATIYLLARSEFWLGRHARAARVFEELFRTTRSVATRADARYQQARCLELAGDIVGASALFAEAYALDPHGEWSGAALLSRLRLEWLSGHRLEAGAVVDLLAGGRGQRSALSRGAIFLAASDLVAGNPSAEVGRWLEIAESSGASSREEVSYWRGRLAELEGRVADAVASYVEAQRRRPFHPLALSAKARLARPELAPEAQRRAASAASGSTLAEAHAAWILQGPWRPVALQARARALSALSGAPHVALWIHWNEVPVADWPLFLGTITRPEDRLLALGLWREGRAALSRQFPVRQRRLAFTASAVLDRFGRSDLALELAERLFLGLPATLPVDWVDPELRRRLFPLPYRNSLLAQASLHRIDPWLLAAIFREESRFDPEAVSPAAARGLAQLVLPTARRVALGMGLRSPSAADLHRPAVAIPIAAAYLAQLEGRFGGSATAALAAYNAGEVQAELWRKYCRSNEPEELLAKIGFRETRAYVVRVLESRAHYAALYGL